MPTVFASYASQDRELVTGKLIELLESHGVDAWVDHSKLRGGDDWEPRIREGLRACPWFLVALSPDAVSSEWVRSEVHWAFGNRKGRIVPVLIRDCDPGELHLMLPRLQYMGSHNHWNRNVR